MFLTELALNGQRITEGEIFQNQLYIWNSGNQELTSDDLGEPIQWSNAPTTIRWSELPLKTDMTFHGIRKDQIEGDLLPGLTNDGIRFKKLYPDTGLVVTFLTKSIPDISLSGSVSGDTNSSGIIKRQIKGIGDFIPYTVGIWLFVFLLALRSNWRDPRSEGWRGYVEVFFLSIAMATLPTFIFLMFGSLWFNHGLPPF